MEEQWQVGWCPQNGNAEQKAVHVNFRLFCQLFLPTTQANILSKVQPNHSKDFVMKTASDISSCDEKRHWDRKKRPLQARVSMNKESSLMHWYFLKETKINASRNYRRVTPHYLLSKHLQSIVFHVCTSMKWALFCHQVCIKKEWKRYAYISRLLQQHM